MKLAYYIIIISVCLGSCKKDKLKDEKAFLIGTWKWIYSEHDYNWCKPPGISEILTVQTENNEYSINFLEKGKVQFFKNQSLLSTHRLRFEYFIHDEDKQCNINNGWRFYINLDNNKETRFWGCVNNDTLECAAVDFPFSWEEGCESYWNYFIKE